MIRRLLISPFHDPYLNLAIEHFLLDGLPENEEILFLYVNDPSVVIGRFQNPWLECSSDRKRETCLVRRESGGGTVYHDRGNLNFSFIQSNAVYDRRENLRRICQVMESCGISLDINKRNDLTVMHEGKCFKVSGSAFRHKKDRAFHHGTLLIEAETERLKSSITPGTQRIFTKVSGTASNRSDIINLNRINRELSIESVLDSFRSLYRDSREYFHDDWNEDEWERLSDKDAIQQQRTVLISEDWILGKTPGFTQDLSRLSPPRSEGWLIEVSKGIIQKTPQELAFLQGMCYGRRNTADELKRRVGRQSIPGLGEDELFSRLILMIG